MTVYLLLQTVVISALVGIGMAELFKLGVRAVARFVPVRP